MKRSMMFTLMLAAIALAGCVKEQVVSGGGGGTTGLGPSLVIEQFMRAVNMEPKDLATMGRLFGTREGPILERDPRSQVEQRMFAIANVLQHDDYQILREQLVPGRLSEATQLVVRIKSGESSGDVPFTMVRHKDGWLIEQIGLDAITNRR